MIIEQTISFDATHRHIVPPGVMSEVHMHRWEWTVFLDGVPHPTYRWVADFNEVRAMMLESVGTSYEGTTEQINAGLAREMTWRLDPTGVVLVRSMLQEKRGQAAWFDPAKDGGAYGPTLEDGLP